MKTKSGMNRKETGERSKARLALDAYLMEMLRGVRTTNRILNRVDRRVSSIHGLLVMKGVANG